MPPNSTPSRLRALGSLLRPHQWLKNTFVLNGILFAHEWNNPTLLRSACIATGAFCLTSSALYAFNDLHDVEMDRLHPVKSQRPLPAGHLPRHWAQGAAWVLTIAGFAIGALASFRVVGFLAAYLVIGFLYTVKLKRVVILDVFGIAAGFMLRLLAGTTGIGIPPSHWLLFCGLMLTIFLASAKRWAEISGVKTVSDQRPVLAQYFPLLLDKMMTISATAALMSYSLYTISPETVAKYKTPDLMYTVPFVAYGLFRYIYLMYRGGGVDIALDLVKDKHLWATFLIWLASVFILTRQITNP